LKPLINAWKVLRPNRAQVLQIHLEGRVTESRIMAVLVATETTCLDAAIDGSIEKTATEEAGG
jgi:hypothetical protein